MPKLAVVEEVPKEKLPFEPLFARVLIWRDLEAKTKGGIILPNAKRHAASVGTVKAVGPTCDPSIQVGMRVVFGKYAGTWLDENGSQLNQEDAEATKGWFVCADEDIILVVK